MRTVHAYAATSAKKPLGPMTIERRELGPRDVLIEIKFCGICHSDIHTARSEWGEATYPLVPGHEIAGIVAQVGSQVSKHAVGDRVGVGCLVDSCGECTNCRKGDEQHCLKGFVGTYGGTGGTASVPQGGYSTHIVVDRGLRSQDPRGHRAAAAAPLLCAGITTYAPLRHWALARARRSAIVGLGGLGHMGVKLAHAMGAEVTVLSQSLSKKEDGLRLGADHYYATKDPETFKKLAGSFDLIVNTVSAKINVDAYLSLLALDGVLVNVGAPASCS